MRLLHVRITQLFPLGAILLAVIACYVPAPFVALKGAIIPLLALVMFAMGMTLSLADFRRVLSRPRIIAIGLVLQFLIMPLAAYLIGTWMGLSLALLTGMVLVGASSGGTASNVICYLARGDVALSITLTLCSTLLAVVALPLLTLLYIGERVPVPVEDMLSSIAMVVIAPVIAGVLLSRLVGNRLTPLTACFPVVSVLAIILIIAIIVALNQSNIATLSTVVIIAVMLHNLTGLLSGYWLTRWLGYDSRTSRTLAIEVGMQNSGLSVALAVKYFTPLAALPGALFSIWHNISGSLLAAYWSRRPT